MVLSRGPRVRTPIFAGLHLQNPTGKPMLHPFFGRQVGPYLGVCFWDAYKTAGLCNLAHRIEACSAGRSPRSPAAFAIPKTMTPAW
jgi:hypothetical protein